MYFNIPKFWTHEKKKLKYKSPPNLSSSKIMGPKNADLDRMINTIDPDLEP